MKHRDALAEKIVLRNSIEQGWKQVKEMAQNPESGMATRMVLSLGMSVGTHLPMVSLLLAVGTLKARITEKTHVAFIERDVR